MSTQAPQVLSRQTNGVLPVPASQAHDPGKGDAPHRKSGRGRASHDKSSEGASKKAGESDTPKPSRPKPHNEGEKLVVRRLPPGMTQAEFSSILGADWEPGKGRVDWFSYVPGKVSTDPSKPSRPSRAYVHVTKKDYIVTLSDAVRASKWEDAQSTFNNPSLIGPPCVEMSIYKKVPSNKKRTDARQGTIDQDPEFMAFLEELANPAPPNQNIEDDVDDASKAETKVTTTPLIEYLKEKKANKAKEAAAAKSAKHARQDAGGKGKGSKDDESTKRKGRDHKADKADKAPKETVKILTKKAAAEQAAEAAKTAANQIKGEKDQDGPKTSRRAGIAAAARILQRDLGLSPGSAHRKARQDAAKADSETKTSSTKEAAAGDRTERPVSPATSTDAGPQTSANRPTTPTAPKAQASGRKNRGGKNIEKSKPSAATAEQSASPAVPVVLLKKKGTYSETASPPTSNSATQTSKDGSVSKTPSVPVGPKSKTGSSQKRSPTVTPDVTRGFVKHANPSQGVTETLLKQALEVFGTITFVEIDKRKGFAYVDFAEHAALVKAMSASPISVAQGTVQVLERKDKKPATTTAALPATGSSATNASEKSSGRGRRGRGGGSKTTAAANNSQQSAPTSTGAAATSGG